MREAKLQHADGVPRKWLAAWGVLVAIGLLGLTSYSMSPGEQLQSLDQRPHGSSIPISQKRPTLLVFLHPRCPCSRATVNELAKLRSNRGAFAVQPVFFLPDDKPDTWAKTDLWVSIERFVSNTPVVDRGGRESSKFAVTTSGHVILVSTSGEILFSGGITNGRGHEGDNIGLTTLIGVIDGESVETRELPVYGCPINARREVRQ